jgi:DNA replication and repair protein RecF
VEHGYREAWQRYARALRQRNAALRMHAPTAQVSAWDTELVDTACILDRMRRRYLINLEPRILEELNALLPRKTLTLRYQSGWEKSIPLQAALEKDLERDCAQCYTCRTPSGRFHLDGRW